MQFLTTTFVKAVAILAPEDVYTPVLEKVHASFVESVPFRSIVIFTIIQIVYFLLCFAECEEITGSPSRAPSFNLREVNNPIRGNDEGEVSICDAEILYELTTSRGELKVRNLSFNEDKRTQQGYMHPE
nr:hypothetical protein [Tanacetum cinerariifolium]